MCESDGCILVRKNLEGGWLANVADMVGVWVDDGLGPGALRGLRGFGQGSGGLVGWRSFAKGNFVDAPI